MLNKVILAIDPGNESTAFVVWNGKQIITKDKLPNKDFKALLDTGHTMLWEIDEVCIETISSYGMAVGQTSFDTCIWIGIYKECLEKRGLQVKLIFRGSVKMHHCHSLTGVNDAAINTVLKKKYGEDNTIKTPNEVYWNESVKNFGGAKSMNGDIWAAFALATFYLEPKDSLIKNPGEREENKLSKSLQ